MVGNALNVITQALQAAFTWFSDMIAAVDGSGIIIAAFLIVAVVSLLIMPLRGAGIGSIKEFAASPVNRHKPNKKSGGSKGGSK